MDYVIDALMDMLLKEMIGLIAKKIVNLMKNILQKMKELDFIIAMI